MRVAPIALALALLASGCGESNDRSGATDAAQTTAEAPDNAPATNEASRCKAASSALIAALRDSLKPDYAGKLEKASVVKSKDFSKVYFVAARVSSADAVATWATNDPRGRGSVFSVGAVTREVSTFGDGGQTDANITLSADGASEATDCASG